MTLIAEKTKERQKKILDFYQGEVSQEELDVMLINPEKALSTSNISIEPTFKEAVLKGLKEANETFLKFENQPALWNNHLILNMNDEEQCDLRFTTHSWGLVLELSHNATQNAIYGISLAACISSAIKSVSKDFPVANVTENIVVSCYTAYLKNCVTIINTIDKGNGVYLTLTWPQIALSVGVLFPTPIATAR